MTYSNEFWIALIALVTAFLGTIIIPFINDWFQRKRDEENHKRTLSQQRIDPRNQIERQDRSEKIAQYRRILQHLRMQRTFYTVFLMMTSNQPRERVLLESLEHVPDQIALMQKPHIERLRAGMDEEILDYIFISNEDIANQMKSIFNTEPNYFDMTLQEIEDMVHNLLVKTENLRKTMQEDLGLN